VWKLDRLGRSLSYLIELMERLKEDQVDFESLSDGINTTTAGGKLVFHIMASLAEFERSLISERSKAGMQAARRHRFRNGLNNSFRLLAGSGRFTVLSTRYQINASVGSDRLCAMCAASSTDISASIQR
jgi:hypothetical protein